MAEPGTPTRRGERRRAATEPTEEPTPAATASVTAVLEEVNQLERDLAAARAENRRLVRDHTDALAQLREENGLLDQRFTTVNQRNANLSNELRAVTGERDEAHNRIQQLGEELRAAQEQVVRTANARDEFVNNMQAEVASLRRENAGARSEKERLEAGHDQLLEALRHSPLGQQEWVCSRTASRLIKHTNPGDVFVCQQCGEPRDLTAGLGSLKEGRQAKERIDALTQQLARTPALQREWQCTECGRNVWNWENNPLFCPSCETVRDIGRELTAGAEEEEFGADWRCLECDTVNRAVFDFCRKPECNKPRGYVPPQRRGAPGQRAAANTWPCPDCGKLNSNQLDSCRACGAANPNRVVPAAAPSHPAEPQKGRWKVTLW